MSNLILKTTTSFPSRYVDFQRELFFLLRGLSLHSLHARLAYKVLDPGILDDLDAVALMNRICSGKVTI